MSNKLYRSTSFNDERKWKSNGTLDDILQVGIKKAIGYIVDNSNYDIKNIKKNLKRNKLSVIVPANTNCLSKTLWVGDVKMIQSILDKYKPLLLKSKWPTEAKLFFEKVSNTDVWHNKNKKLYHLICELFNSWCLWCEVPVWTDASGNKVDEPLSQTPFDSIQNHIKRIINDKTKC